jgi:hypothetical protein
MREREETKVDLDRAWEESQACIAQLEEARKLSVDLQQVVDEHPGTRSLRDKLEESNQDLHRLHHEINQLQNTIATELCSRARYTHTLCAHVRVCVCVCVRVACGLVLLNGWMGGAGQDDGHGGSVPGRDAVARV